VSDKQCQYSTSKTEPKIKSVLQSLTCPCVPTFVYPQNNRPARAPRKSRLAIVSKKARRIKSGILPERVGCGCSIGEEVPTKSRPANEAASVSHVVELNKGALILDGSVGTLFVSIQSSKRKPNAVFLPVGARFSIMKSGGLIRKKRFGRVAAMIYRVNSSRGSGCSTDPYV